LFVLILVKKNQSECPLFSNLRCFIMRRFFPQVILLLPLFFSALYAVAQTESCNNRDVSYGAGESLTFNVYYNVGLLWIYTGNANLSIADEVCKGKSSYHVTGVGKTAKSYELFFKVNDRYETFIDKETMLPMKFIRDVSEGNIKIKNNITFNQTKNKALSDTTTFKIPKCTQDMLSAIYFARNIDFDKYGPGDRIQFNLFLDNKVYSLYIKYLGKEKIKTKMGEYNAIKISPQVITGSIFKDDDKLTVWVSDDANHLPLRVSTPILVGSIKVDLVGYDNLRNPFASMLKEF